MAIWDRLFGRSRAATLPDVELPKPQKGQKTIPSYRPQKERSNDLLRRVRRVSINTDAVELRYNTSPSQMIRDFLSANPDMAATVNAYLRVGIPTDYKLMAFDMDGRINVEATKLAHEILARITFLGDPSQGFNPTSDLQSLSETLGRELLLEGGMAMELVLDDQQLPLYPQPVAVSTLEFREDTKRGVYPVQVVAGEEIDLDIPTMFYVSVDQDLLTPFSVGFLAVALRSVLADEQFSNFLLRQLKRNIAPRMIAKVIEDTVKRSVSADVLNDPEKFAAYMGQVISTIESNLTELEPEDAIITTDAVEYELKAPGGSGTGVGNMLEAVHGILQDRVTAALKSLPAVLGRDTSSGSATTSTYLFLKSAGVISTKLNTIYSRMLTVAVRLLGENCYVEFRYDPLDLRPKMEQEAYKAMEQSRVLELLSLGLVTDEWSSITLTGRLPPEGYTPLAGTMFKYGKGELKDTTSQTSLMNGQKDDLKSDAPTKPKGEKK